MYRFYLLVNYNLGIFLIKWCDKEMKIARNNNRMSAFNNIMNCGEIILLYRIEIIRNHDAIQEEYWLAFRKYKSKIEILDLVSRAIVCTEVMNGVIMSYCGFNHYAIRDYMINRSAIIDKCTMCLETETWKHVIICEKTEDIRIDYILDLKKELIKIESYYKDCN